MADNFVHVKGTDEFHDFIDRRGLKKKRWCCAFFFYNLKKLVKVL